MKLELVRFHGLRREWYWDGQEMYNRIVYQHHMSWYMTDDEPMHDGWVRELEAARLKALTPNVCERFGRPGDAGWRMCFGPRTVIFWDSGLITSGLDFQAAEIKFNTQASAFTWLFTGRTA